MAFVRPEILPVRVQKLVQAFPQSAFLQRRLCHPLRYFPDFHFARQLFQPDQYYFDCHIDFLGLIRPLKSSVTVYPLVNFLKLTTANA